LTDDPLLSLELHIKSLRRYALVLVRTPDRADDLVQESLKRVLANIRQGNTVHNLRPYLFSVLHNVYTDEWLRRKGARNTVPLEEAPVLTIGPSQEARMECRDVARALDRLPEEQREVILLIAMEGFSYQAAAQILCVPAGTIMSRLSRARRNLRRLVDGETVRERERVRVRA